MMKDIEINDKKIKVISTVDAVGLYCPLPIVKLKLEIEKVRLNDVVELLADDPGVSEDLGAWCNETGNILLSIEKSEGNIYVAFVKKNKE